MKRQTIWLTRNLNVLLSAVPLIELVMIALKGIPGVTSARVVLVKKGGLIVSFDYGGAGLLVVPDEYFGSFGLLQPDGAELSVTRVGEGEACHVVRQFGLC